MEESWIPPPASPTPPSTNNLPDIWLKSGSFYLFVFVYLFIFGADMSHHWGWASKNLMLQIPVYCRQFHWTSAKNNTHPFLRGAALSPGCVVIALGLDIHIVSWGLPCSKTHQIKVICQKAFRRARSGQSPHEIVYLSYLSGLPGSHQGTEKSSLMTDNLLKKLWNAIQRLLA